jgi:peptide/nickel transport system permease protein
LLPHVVPVLTTHALLLVPQLILAESTLSFLGLGASDAAPSLGTLLVPLQRPHLLLTGWWLAAPAAALVLLLLLYHRATDRLSTGRPSAMLMP